VSERDDKTTPTSDWSLDDLSAKAETRLSELGLLDAPVDGRVARAADPRTVRYYQSLGILDRPLSYEGHKARYGPRHLLQLLAVKALQRLRLPLAEIQERLYGKSDAELEALLASAGLKARHHAPRVPVKLSREVVLSPGLKLVADGAWSLGEDPEQLIRIFRAALDALNQPQT
jgi:DNA-binding transcriptional MerR regulator